MRKKEVTYSFLAIIIFLGFFSYTNIYQNNYVWDDLHFIKDNRFIQGFHKEIFTMPIGAGAGPVNRFYRPMQQVAYATVYSLFGPNLGGYHFLSVFFHVGSAVLLFILIKKLFNKELLAFLTSLLWVIHPIHTESVTYMSGLSAPMMVFFGLASFLSYIYFREKKKAQFLIISVALFILALLSKEIIVTLPLLLIAYELTVKRSKLHKLKNSAPYFIIIFFYFILRSILNINSFVHENFYIGVIPRILTFLNSLLTYYKLLIIPKNLHLDYEVPFLNSLTIPVLLSIIIIGLLAYLGYFYNKKGKSELSFGILWFFIAFIPMSGVIRVNNLFFEHWLYLPSIGFFLVLSYLILKVFEYHKILLPSFIIAVVIILVTITLQQNVIWKDAESLYTHTLKFEKGTARVHNNLGNILIARNKLTEAEHHLLTSINLSKQYRMQSYYNLGRLYFKQGKFNQSLIHLHKSVDINPNFFYGYEWLAKVYNATGNYEEYEKFKKLEKKNKFY
tara:strand:+ start:1713 stop:3224 length:1512 start_codon:yes stop_codon:yes gene_type:complete